MHVISEEAIDFQVTTSKNLANELTVLFQQAIDYKNGLDGAPSFKIEAMFKFFTETTAPKLIATVQKYTGIQFSIACFKYLAANYAVAMDFEGDQTSVEGIIRKYSGLLNSQNVKKNRFPILKTVEELNEFSSALQRSTGFVNAAMMAKHQFKCKLYFDVYGSFLIKETGAEACEPLTAYELTAVVLHEIGHVLSFIEHAADAYYKRDVIDAATKEFFKQADDSEKLKYIGSTLSTIYPELEGSIKKINSYTDKNKRGFIAWSGIRILISTIWAIISCLGLGACKLIIGLISHTWNASIGGGINALKGIKAHKVGDYAQTAENGYFCEQLADEYVTRFGYGGHLATQLSKLYAWSRITGLGDMHMKQFATASIFGRLLPWMIYTSFFGDQYSKDYPTEKKRYELLLLDTLKAFKEMDVSEEILNDYYRSYRTIKKLLDNPSSNQKYAHVWNILHDAVNYIVKTPEELIFSGRFDREYDRLYQQVQSLSNNELYAVAYRLKTLNKG